MPVSTIDALEVPTSNLAIKYLDVKGYTLARPEFGTSHAGRDNRPVAYRHKRIGGHLREEAFARECGTHLAARAAPKLDAVERLGW